MEAKGRPGAGLYCPFLAAFNSADVTRCLYVRVSLVSHHNVSRLTPPLLALKDLRYLQVSACEQRSNLTLNFWAIGLS